jgi:hypothetical protein
VGTTDLTAPASVSPSCEVLSRLTAARFQPNRRADVALRLPSRSPLEADSRATPNRSQRKGPGIVPGPLPSACDSHAYWLCGTRSPALKLFTR